MVFFPRYPFWCAKISLVKLYWDFCILKGWLNVNFWDMVLPTPCLKTVLLKLWVFWSRISLPNYKFLAKNQRQSLSTKFVETRKNELNSRGETWRWIPVRIYPSLFDRNDDEFPCVYTHLFSTVMGNLNWIARTRFRLRRCDCNKPEFSKLILNNKCQFIITQLFI